METESWTGLKLQLHFYFFTVFHFLVFTDGAYRIVVPTAYYYYYGRRQTISIQRTYVRHR